MLAPASVKSAGTFWSNNLVLFMKGSPLTQQVTHKCIFAFNSDISTSFLIMMLLPACFVAAVVCARHCSFGLKVTGSQSGRGLEGSCG